MLGVPMVIVAIDLLGRQRLTEKLRTLLFQPDATQLTEPRETVWAVALLVAGLLACAWGLKELLSPSKVLVADEAGIQLKIRGPLARPHRLAWEDLVDVGSGTVDDEGDHLPVVWFRVADRALLPDNPWGARPIDERTLAVLASDWETSHVAAAEAVSAWALSRPQEHELEPAPEPEIIPDDL